MRDGVKIFLMVVGLCLLMGFASSCSQALDRDRHNMGWIYDNYVYDMDTGIVYIESYSGMRNIYSVYVNENGNYCKYNPKTKEWSELDD